MNKVTKSQRRAELADMMRRRLVTPVATLAKHFEVRESVIKRDLAVLERRFQTYRREHPGMLCERLRHLSREAEAAGEFGDAIRAEAVLGKITGAIPSDSVNVSANAQATAAVTTFAELARKAQQEFDAANRLTEGVPPCPN